MYDYEEITDTRKAAPAELEPIAAARAPDRRARGWT